MNRLLFLVSLLLIVLALTACGAAAAEPTEEPLLPTLAPTITPQAMGVDAAQRVAVLFFEAWRVGDFPGMYAQIAFSSQEATPLENFTAIYEGAHAEMTLESIEYTINTIWDDDPNAVGMLVNYDATFTTRLVGTFTDSGRDLQLIVDPSVGTWRVAWSVGDIFAELDRGGQLRLERTIPSRANIYDRTGERVLADQEGRYVTISVVKQDIPQVDTCMALLAETTLETPEELQRTLDNAGADWITQMGVAEPQVWEARRGELEELCGATFTPYPVRRYPEGTLMPHILGYVGYPDQASIPAIVEAGFNQDSILGRSGIELSWDETLRGRVGARLVILGVGSGVLRELARSAPQPGQSVWLTIDAELQAYAQQVIVDDYNRGVYGTQSKGTSLVVMNVNTGEILAMVSYPTFDNNAFTAFPMIGRTEAARVVPQIQEDERTPQLNRVTQGAYPSGSTMKVVTATAGVDSGVWPIDQRYNSIGVWERDIPRVDWRPGGHGSLTPEGALIHSCNTCFYEMGYQLDLIDPFILPNYARRMGLGVDTGLRELPTNNGTIPDPDWILENRGWEWRFSDSVNMAIGQGEVEVTPLQFARVTASIANGGTHYRPQLVKQVGILGEVPTYTLQPEVIGTTDVQPEVTAMVQNAMCAVTTESFGTAEFVFSDSPLQAIGVCGKTGTAQTTGADSLPHGWFIAYAPRENPQVAVVAMVENVGNGSEFAAPIVRRVLEYYFGYTTR